MLHWIVQTGPTSFAPIIEMAITIVEQSRGQYHVLLIIADGQVFPYGISLISDISFTDLIFLMNVNMLVVTYKSTLAYSQMSLWPSC